MSWKDEFPKENRYFETENGILYYGEAIKTMSKFPKEFFDAIITDAPYGTTACKWDSVIPFNDMWKCLKNIRKDRTPIVLFGSEPFSSNLRMSNVKEYKYDWIWEKEQGTGFARSKKQPLRKHEIISVFYKKQPFYNSQGEKLDRPKKIKRKINSNNKSLSDKLANAENRISLYTHKTKHTILRFNRDKGLHPTQKPVALMEYLIKTYTNENDVVLDFTCGSGTTLVACEKLNRRYVGIELEQKYCEITKDRLIKAIDDKGLFR